MPRGNSNILCPKIPRIFANKIFREKQNLGEIRCTNTTCNSIRICRNWMKPQPCFPSLVFCRLSQQTYLYDCSKRTIWWNLFKVTLLKFGNDVLWIITYRAIVWYSVTYTCIKKVKRTSPWCCQACQVAEHFALWN